VYAGSGNVDGLHKNFRFKKMHHCYEDKVLAVGCGHVCVCDSVCVFLSNGFGLFNVLSAISSIKNDYLPVKSTYFLNQSLFIMRLADWSFTPKTFADLRFSD
jgi:hypothetical protein